MNNLIDRAIENQVASDKKIVEALELAGFRAERMPDHRGIVVHEKKRNCKFKLSSDGVANALQLTGLGHSSCQVRYSEFYARPFVMAR